MGKLNKLVPLVALIALSGLIILSRLHTYEEPLERDITTYAVIAHEMIGGKALYSDLWDHKPPAIHVTYAAAELFAGYGRDSIFLLNIAAALGTLLACYFAGSALRGGHMGGLVAASLWALVSGDLALEGNQPNTEVFLNFFLTAGFAIFVRSEKSGLTLRGVLIAGSLFALASLYKQIVVVNAGLLAVAYCAQADKGSRQKALVDVAMIAAIGAVVWAGVIGYFAARGRLTAFWEAVFTFNRWYSGDVRQNLGQFMTWPHVSPDVIAALVTMGAFSVAGLAIGLFFGSRRPWIFLFAFALGAHVAVLLPGHFFPHYYQLWLPPLTIGVGWTVALLRRIVPIRLSWLSPVAASVACIVLLIIELPYYRASAESWSEQKYGSVFLECDRLAKTLDRVLPANATFYNWGDQTGLYFASHRSPPSGVTFAIPAIKGPLIGKLSQRLIDDLGRTRPDLIVTDHWMVATTASHPVFKWLENDYCPVFQTNTFWIKQQEPPYFVPDQFLIYARKGSPLAGALN
jgi:4-amino-4-deoxy-L-arabinose transferase-like glycosyltransferase